MGTLLWGPSGAAIGTLPAPTLPPTPHFTVKFSTSAKNAAERAPRELLGRSLRPFQGCLAPQTRSPKTERLEEVQCSVRFGSVLKGFGRFRTKHAIVGGLGTAAAQKSLFV